MKPLRYYTVKNKLLVADFIDKTVISFVTYTKFKNYLKKIFNTKFETIKLDEIEDILFVDVETKRKDQTLKKIHRLKIPAIEFKLCPFCNRKT